MHSHPHAIIITSCTNRKRDTGEVVALRACEEQGSLEALARTWIASVEAAQHRQPALSLYQGRSFTEAKYATEAASGLLYVASAGHGLVRFDHLLPSYDLTVATNPSNSLQIQLTRFGKAANDWWQTLTSQFDNPRSLRALMSDSSLASSPVLLAMPSTYLNMMSDDLASLSAQQVDRLRVITSELGASQLPDRLRTMVLPYDARLEGHASYAGTRNDFAQRALHHFIVVLKGHTMPLDSAKKRVADAMRALTQPVLPKRERKSDAEIEKLILKNWVQYNGSQSALLRWLRDEQLISCEQSRFRQLWYQVHSKIISSRTGQNGKA